MRDGLLISSYLSLHTMGESLNITQESVLESTSDIINVLKEELEGAQIEFKDFNYEVVSHESYIEILLTLRLIVEGEDIEKSYILRFFTNMESYNSEKSMYNELQQRLRSIENIHLFRVIHYDDQKSRVIYECRGDNTLEQVESLYSSFLLGNVSSMIHGDSASYIDFKPLHETFLLFIDNIPFEEETRDLLKRVLKERFESLGTSYSGYIPLTELRREDVRINSSEPIENMDLYNISKLNGIEVFIPMVSPTFEVKDRLSDLGRFYADSAFREYCETGNLDNTMGSLESFISGYSSSLYERSGVRLKNLYPNGLTIDIQLALNVWISEAMKLDVDNIEHEHLVKMAKFTEYVLDKKFTQELLLSET